MRIRTQFYVTLLLFGIVLAIISASAIITNQQVEKADKQEMIAHSIAQGASELSYLATNYVVYRQDPQLERWQSRYASFSVDVAGLQSNEPDQKELINNIREGSLRLERVFNNVVSKLAEQPQSDSTPINPDILQPLAISSQELMSDASRLSQLYNNQVDSLQMTNTLIVVALVIILIGYFVVNFLVTQRRVLESVADLQAGTAVIGGGNLDFRLEEKKNNEIGDLARAFNRMTADLKVVIATKTDLESEIAERKKVEITLQENQELLNRSQEIAHLGSWELNLESNKLTWSDEVYRIFGLEPQEFGATYEAFLEAVHPDDRAAVDAAYTGSLKEGRDCYEIEHRVVRKSSGEVRYVHERCEHITDESGKIIASIGMVHDITDRKKAEDQLRLQATLWENMHDAVVAMDKHFTITAWNRAATELYGWEKEEAIGENAWEIMHRGAREEHISEITAKLAAEGIATCDLDHQHKDGGKLHIEARLVTLTDASGQIIGYISAGRDISERKRAEEELKHKNVELEASNRELEAFSYSVSHDLRAPLRSMEGFSSALLEDYAEKLDDQGRQYLGYIQESSDLMGRLIDDLLKLSRVTRSEIKREGIDLSEMAWKIVADLGKSEPQRVVNLEIASDIKAYGDRNLLRLVLENLLGNAWKFTSKTDSPQIEMGITEHDGRQAYYVRDNGVGFNMKYADKLFQPFQRLHKTTEFAGTGIGLATVQRIIHRHGGEVWAESRPGEGTTFYFTLG